MSFIQQWVNHAATNPPPGHTLVKITKHSVDALRTDSGGFTEATVTALGLKWKELRKGWTYLLIGREISEAQYAKALDGRTRFRGRKGWERGQMTIDVREDAPERIRQRKTDGALAFEDALDQGHEEELQRLNGELDQQFLDAMRRDNS